MDKSTETNGEKPDVQDAGLKEEKIHGTRELHLKQAIVYENNPIVDLALVFRSIKCNISKLAISIIIQ